MLWSEGDLEGRVTTERAEANHETPESTTGLVDAGVRSSRRGKVGGVSALPLAEATRDAGVVAAWDRAAAACDHPDALQSSRAWAEHLNARGLPVQVVVLRGRDGVVRGVVPVTCHPRGFEGAAAAPRGLRRGFRVAEVLGSVPLVPSYVSAAEDVMLGVLGALPDCDAVSLESLPVESPYARLEEAATVVLAYRPSVARAERLVEIEGSFETYQRGRSAKLRLNVERAFRKLHGIGTVSLGCYRSPADVDRLFTDAAELRKRSRQHAELGGLAEDPILSCHESLSELSRRDLLRAYVLYAGGVPCAFVIGHQCQGAFFHALSGFDAAFARHSPGIALLHLVVNDLFASDRPRFASLGRRDDDYKRRFATANRYVGTWLYFRPTLMNRMRVQNHRLLARAKGLIAEFRAAGPSRVH